MILVEDKSNTRRSDLLKAIGSAEAKTVSSTVVPIFNGNKISLRNSVFTFFCGGEETSDKPRNALEVIIIKAAPLSRSYYEREFNEQNPSTPFCWSDDTRTGTPSPNVSPENKQSQTCFNCVWNVKGSGKGDSRGCRFHQRIVVMVGEDGIVSDNTLYQIQLPATSVFGSDSQKMGMQAYAGHLTTHKTPLAAVITEIRFDKHSSIPKLLFKPLRAITENEFKLAVDAQNSPESDATLAFSLGAQSPFTATEGFTL